MKRSMRLGKLGAAYRRRFAAGALVMAGALGLVGGPAAPARDGIPDTEIVRGATVVGGIAWVNSGSLTPAVLTIRATESYGMVSVQLRTCEGTPVCGSSRLNFTVPEGPLASLETQNGYVRLQARPDLIFENPYLRRIDMTFIRQTVPGANAGCADAVSHTLLSVSAPSAGLASIVDNIGSWQLQQNGYRCGTVGVGQNVPAEITIVRI